MKARDRVEMCDIVDCVVCCDATYQSLYSHETSSSHQASSVCRDSSKYSQIIMTESQQ